ncbi:GntR family transcriptional regulator [Cupriavidus sp. USMAA2-4]|uniref:GntR family transcriptional regulator n=1 Tax=Cupriavidus malaysiensis TaxID=367825 RepID=A0ABN4TXR3_9BURK|nr:MULTISPECIES: GntR family transcriptional regulator [Cupriavidus]AOY96818.1 GntR family transcriptional regulator [Cupriavidus sp. USMAA2-4]AOZ02776.1 GntR family transcriptional regulator [Cupriavidus sp. USMAHM13]AOZ09850.1 GntR family transcriptional regulator [Cupriavidus malaysiensis]
MADQALDGAPDAPDASDAPDVPDALQRAIDALEEDIVFGRLHPRERLVEDDLMERFGLKRHVVRQALSALEQMGAVERRRNVGALVRAFEPEEVVELFGLRELLEAQAAALIPLPVPPVRLQALVAVQRRHDAAVAAGDAHAVFRINQQFHRELFALAGNTVLLQAIAEYARRTHPIRFGSLATAAYRERARQEHWAMIDALRAGRREELVALCRQHLQPSRDAYLAAQRERAGGALTR